MSRSGTSMRCLVTGCAGFIGSHRCDRLLSDGHEVIGIDAFSDLYPRAEKERNLESSLQSPSFTLHDSDFLITGLESILDGVDVVFHLAGQTGVRSGRGPQVPAVHGGKHLTGLRDGLCDEVALLREAGAGAPFFPARLANTRAV